MSWRHLLLRTLNGRTGTTRPDGHHVEWLTYGTGHVHGLLLDGQELVSFERDALHREAKRTQANGLLQTMKYDPAGRLLEQQLGAIAQANQPVYPNQYRPDVQVGMQAAILRRYRYDASGQLTGIEDNRRGRIDYRYDPVGRLLAANSALGHETFAFDPAGNIQTPDTVQQGHFSRNLPLPKLLDNLLKEYGGVSYRYDNRGNLIERMQNAQRDTFEWDAFNRMTRATTRHGVTTFAYDPLGRRIAKHSQAMEGTTLRKTTRTMYGWDGDTLALESSAHDGYTAGERTVHYVYERDSFVPLVQATRSRALQLAPTTDVKALMAGNEGKYDIALDPLWNGEAEQEAEPFGKDEIVFYQCDHLGTPQELTDCEGKVAWSAQYKAWGEAKQAISEAAYKAGIRNPLRFQGQYEDEETGLFYNRYRYYESATARYLTRDPIGLAGGANLYQYAPNSIGWADPLGLNKAQFPKLGSKIKEVRAGKDVTVCSFKEADAVLYGAFPDAQKVAGSGPKSNGKTAQDKQRFKELRQARNGQAVFHKDYLLIPGTNTLYGHEDLEDGHVHKHTPHINVITPEGQRATIYIEKNVSCGGRRK